jgi:hypothetical protein
MTQRLHTHARSTGVCKVRHVPTRPVAAQAFGADDQWDAAHWSASFGQGFGWRPSSPSVCWSITGAGSLAPGQQRATSEGANGRPCCHLHPVGGGTLSFIWSRQRDPEGTRPCLGDRNAVGAGWSGWFLRMSAGAASAAADDSVAWPLPMFAGILDELPASGGGPDVAMSNSARDLTGTATAAPATRPTSPRTLVM